MPVSRFSQVSRRAFLSGASLAAITGLAACGSNDQSSGSSTTQAATTPTETASAVETTSAAATTAATSSATASAASGGTLPSSAQATVSFTYTTSGGGMAKNPYYAVWIEDASGAFVKTLLLCHLSGQDRWLNELSAWYQASGGTDTTTEGTKPAGTYSVTWDGTDANGARVAAGTYTVCIEANREHGQESLVTSQQAFGTKALDVDLGTNGELTAAHLKYTA